VIDRDKKTSTSARCTTSWKSWNAHYRRSRCCERTLFLNDDTLIVPAFTSVRIFPSYARTHAKVCFPKTLSKVTFHIRFQKARKRTGKLVDFRRRRSKETLQCALNAHQSFRMRILTSIPHCLRDLQGCGMGADTGGAGWASAHPGKNQGGPF